MLIRQEISIIVILLGILGVLGRSLPETSVVVFYSTTGGWRYGTKSLYADVLTQAWKERIATLNNDPSWPVNITVEAVDANSDDEFLISWILNRVNQTHLPPVSAIMFADVGYYDIPAIDHLKIPLIPMTASTRSGLAGQGDGYNYSFSIQAPAQNTYITLSEKYAEIGVKSVVSVWSNETGYFPYNYDSCVRVGDELMAPKGIEHIGSFAFNVGDSVSSSSELKSLAKQIEDLNPDAILLCDGTGCYDEDHLWFGDILEDIDYLPKAVSTLDCYGFTKTERLAKAGKMNYFTQSTFTHSKMSGVDYTEGATPYSSQFRPTNKVVTVADELNTGSNSATSPSSTKLFTEWFYNTTGTYPQYGAVGIWGAFDIVEAAIWKAAQSSSATADGKLTAEELYPLLLTTQAPTPYGRIIFNSFGVNTASPAIVMQYIDSNLDTEIVSPGDIQTASFIYPMPTWSERTYTWSLFKGEVYSAIAIGATGSFLIMMIMVTLIWKRNEKDIMMLRLSHMLGLGVSCLVVIWSSVFVWQADIVQTQCDLYLWTIYLPGSFVILLISMKAYRLSVFLTCEDIRRKRKLSHQRILIYTLISLGVTAFFLAMCQIFDPPRRTKVSTDIYRPSTDYYVCRSHNNITSSILYTVFVIHVIISMYCIIAVRNGMEAFKDGMIMKEAFLVLYSCVLVAYIMSQLSLNPNTIYLLRVCFISIGFTAYVLRLLLSRCARHWVSEPTYKTMVALYAKMVALIPSGEMNDAKVAAVEKYAVVDADDDGIEDHIKKFLPQEAQIQEMLSVIQDAKRSRLFREVAQKSLVVENVDFLEAVFGYPEKAAEGLSESSTACNEGVKAVVLRIFEQFMKENSENEVNISSNTRKKFIQRLEEWPKDKPMISSKLALNAIKEDLTGTNNIFQDAVGEISMMLCQNIWNKYRTAETESQMVHNSTVESRTRRTSMNLV